MQHFTRRFRKSAREAPGTFPPLGFLSQNFRTGPKSAQEGRQELSTPFLCSIFRTDSENRHQKDRERSQTAEIAHRIFQMSENYRVSCPIRNWGVRWVLIWRLGVPNPRIAFSPRRGAQKTQSQTEALHELLENPRFSAGKAARAIRYFVCTYSNYCFLVMFLSWVPIPRIGF